MTNYSKTTNFTAKDSLVSGDANKIVKGSEIDTEFDNIATASATKANIASPAFTGVVSFPDGTAGDPSITNTGDTNTGLFFSAADTLAFSAAGTAQFTMADGAIAPVTDNDVDLGTSSLEFKDGYFDGTLYTDAINLDGTAITSTAAEINILDGVTATAAELNILDGVTSTAAELNLLDGVTATTTELNYNDTGSAVGTVVASKVVTADANKDVSSFRNVTLTGELDAGTLDIAGNGDIDGNLFIGNNLKLDSDAAVLGFGADEDVTLTHVADTGLLLNSTMALQFNDASQFINAPSATVLDINATDEIELNATAIDINGAVDISGNLDVGGNLVVTGTTTFNGGTLTLGDAASDNVVFGADVNSNIIPNTDNTYDLGSSSQEWKDLYVDGIAYLDGINFNGTAISATAAELNVLDGITAVVGELNALDLGSTAVGTAIASKAVILDSNKDYTGIRNFTITGELDAATLDISGDIDVDGTANLDVVDIDGAVDMASTLAVGGVVTANAGIVVDNITIDGTEIDLSSGDLTLDVAGNIILDADGAVVKIQDGGADLAQFSSGSQNLNIRSLVADKDIRLQGYNGDLSTLVTGLTIDFSEAGAATFNSSLIVPGFVSHTGDSNTFFGFPADDQFRIEAGGSERISITTTETVINEDHADLNFRVESDTNGHMLFVDAGTDRVAVGHSAPSEVLHVVAANPVLTISSSSVDQLARLELFEQKNGSTDLGGFFEYSGASSNSLLIGTTLNSTDTTHLYLPRDGNGNVGIGGAPDSDSGLHLKGDGKRILIDSNDYNLVSLGRSGSSGAGLDTAYFRMKSAGTNKVVIHAGGDSYFNGGNVGIGQSSPDTLLHLAGADTAVIRLENTDTSLGANQLIGGVEFEKTDGSGAGTGVVGGMRMKSDGSVGEATYLAFSTSSSSANDVEALRIDGSGNLLVGTTNTLPAISNVEGIALSAGSYGGRLEVSRAGAEAVSINRKTDDGSLISFKKDGTTVGSIGVLNGDNLTISGAVADHAGLQFALHEIVPMEANADSNGTISLGSNNSKFDDIYATNGTIQTSDRNEKQDIEALSDAEQRVAVAAKGLLRKFRFKSAVEEKGDDARIHFGIIAQDLQDAFTAEGLDAGRYAMFISSTWTDEETGEERTRMGVRYSELLAFIISAI